MFLIDEVKFVALNSKLSAITTIISDNIDNLTLFTTPNKKAFMSPLYLPGLLYQQSVDKQYCNIYSNIYSC